MLLLYLTLVL